MTTKKGFTLLELLIVIGILAILSTSLVLVINPAELLRRARDSQRISDLSTLEMAIALYITETPSPNIGSASTTYSTLAGVTCFGGTSSTTSLAINGSGWIPINFESLTIGSPIGSLPKDPNQSAIDGNPTLYYVYGVANASKYTFKLVANMESAYYKNGGAGDVESTDGGANNYLYEVGTGRTLSISTTTTCYTNSN